MSHRRLQQPPRHEVRRPAWIAGALVAAALSLGFRGAADETISWGVRPLLVRWDELVNASGTIGSGQAGQLVTIQTRLRPGDVARRRRGNNHGQWQLVGRLPHQDQRAPARHLRRGDDRLGATPAAAVRLFLSTPARAVPGGRSGAAAVLAQEDTDRSVRPRARCLGESEARADHQDRRRRGWRHVRHRQHDRALPNRRPEGHEPESRLAHRGREALLHRRLQPYRPPLSNILRPRCVAGLQCGRPT